MRWSFSLFDFFKGPRIFQIFWHLTTKVSRLTEAEVDIAASVLGSDSIRFQDVRIAEGRFLRLVFRFNGNRAFTTFHTINLNPEPHQHARSNKDILVHELVHVYQFEVVGSIYIWQALRAQRTEGYDYGGAEGLAEAITEGKHFRDFNREQQGKIVEDYFTEVLEKQLAPGHQVRLAYEPLIEELHKGNL